MSDARHQAAVVRAAPGLAQPFQDIGLHARELPFVMLGILRRQRSHRCVRPDLELLDVVRGDAEYLADDGHRQRKGKPVVHVPDRLFLDHVEQLFRDGFEPRPQSGDGPRQEVRLNQLAEERVLRWIRHHAHGRDKVGTLTIPAQETPGITQNGADVFVARENVERWLEPRVQAAAGTFEQAPGGDGRVGHLLRPHQVELVIHAARQRAWSLRAVPRRSGPRRSRRTAVAPRDRRSGQR